MPYLVLILGICIGLFALYRFFIKASVEQIRYFFRACIIIVYGIIMVFFALTGRIIISIGLLILCIPFVIGHFKKIREERRTKTLDDDDPTDE